MKIERSMARSAVPPPVPASAPTGTQARVGSAGAPSVAREASDSVAFSREGLAALQSQLDESTPDETSAGEADDGATTQSELTPEESEQVRGLQARDREVRAHESAHSAAAGGLATGGPSYTYERGPDGRNYAVGGEVQVQLKDGRTPQETMSNAQRARSAALAPANPSSQDRAVAGRAAQKEARARAELQAARSEGKDEGGAPAPGLEQRARAYEETAAETSGVSAVSVFA